MTSRRQHPSWSRITIAALGTGVLQLSLLGVAHAEEDSATEIAAARTLAVDGLKLAQAGKCDEAIPKLERSEKLHHSAIVLSRLGECQVSQGKLVEGTEMLRKVLREPLPANPTPAASKAYERAQTVLDAAKPRIAGLTVSVTAPPGAELRLTVDGVVVANTLVDSELPADPGDHLVEASAPGCLKATARVSLASADKKTVTLKLEADPNAPATAPLNSGPEAKPVLAAQAAPAVAASAPSAPPQAPRKAPSRAPAYVSWGVGLVGVGVGTAFGIMAMNAKHDLDGTCQSNSCPPSSSGDVDSAKQKGNISTIGFAVGGAGLVLGTILYFSIGSGSSEAHASAPARSFAGLQRGRAMIGPGSVQLAADF
ncbi:MAG TPA: hypothetical protein VER12_10940 [Polyangiaceae bacterium]|nr:hypothetical protein [Polyangiaceae bacterium]